MVRAGLLLLVGWTVLSALVVWSLAAARHQALGVRPESIAVDHSNVEFPSRNDHLLLVGWLCRAPHSNGRSIILVHDWHQDRSAMAPLARALISRGFDVLLFDLRAAGLSDGAWQTLGNHEAWDVLGAYDFMRRRGYRAGSMTLLGAGAGGAAVIQAAPQASDVAAIVSDSAYADLLPRFEATYAQVTHLPTITDDLAQALSRVTGIDPMLRPIDVVGRHPERAFLFVHSATDRVTPEGDAEQLRDASANPSTQLVVVPGRDHLDTFSHDPERYLQVVNAFIAEQIGEASGASVPSAPAVPPG